MKTKLFSLFLASLMATSAFASVKIGDLYYLLVDEDHTAQVTFDVYGDDNYQGLESVTVPAEITYGSEKYAVTGIGYQAFRRCATLKTVTLPESLKTIETYAFTKCSSLESIDITAGVMEIQYSAFENCNALKSVTLHEGLIALRDFAFSLCSQLESIDIPAGVEIIEEGVFTGCKALQSVTLPKSLISIGDNVFFGCGSVAQITNYATTPQLINTNVFDGNVDYPAVDKSTSKLYVPKESVDAYKAAAVWQDFANILPIEGEEGVEEVESQKSKVERKVIRDGQLLIERNGKTFNAVGAEIR